METNAKLFSDSDEDVQIVEEVFVVDVVNNEIPQDQFDKIVVLGENTAHETTETCCLENRLERFSLQDHDYTADSSKVSLGPNLSTRYAALIRNIVKLQPKPKAKARS